MWKALYRSEEAGRHTECFYLRRRGNGLEPAERSRCEHENAAYALSMAPQAGQSAGALEESRRVSDERQAYEAERMMVYLINRSIAPHEAAVKNERR